MIGSRIVDNRAYGDENIDKNSGEKSPDELRQAVRRHGMIRTWIEYLIAATILRGATLLPRRLALRFGNGVSWLVWQLLPRLRRYALINLRLAFPELSETARERIARGSYRSLGRLLAEISQFPRLNPRNIGELVVYDGLEHYLAALATGRGVIFLTGHIGAWELSVYAHSVHGYPSSFLARRIDNPLIERIAERYRTMYGNRSIDKQHGVREVIRTLRSGGVVGILADLNSLRDEGVFCDFFGVPASTTIGVATLALRTEAVVLPGYLTWDESTGRHTLHFEPPVETIRTGHRETDVQTNTARYTKILEDIIRRYPDQWLWIHRRWRTRPVGEPDIY